MKRRAHLIDPRTSQSNKRKMVTEACCKIQSPGFKQEEEYRSFENYLMIQSDRIICVTEINSLEQSTCGGTWRREICSPSISKIPRKLFELLRLGLLNNV